MPVEFLYLAALLIAIIFWFVVLKRPIYEGMIIGYVVLVAVTGQWADFFTHLKTTSTNTLFYAIIAFLALAQIFGGTKVIDDAIEVILSIVGRLRGGAGYVALAASTFMASLSGSGAGNVAATGVFTIPAMKRTGFPSHLAANVEMAASTMGCMIPPAGSITLAFGCYTALYGTEGFTMSNFWLLLWGIGLWFILQRAVTLYFFCRYYKVAPMPKEEVPKLSDTIKKGWKSIIIPLVIFLPFFLDARLKAGLFTNLIGSGANSFSSCVLLFTPGLAALYSFLIARKRTNVSPKAMAEMLKKSVLSIVPVSVTIFFAYSAANLFSALGASSAIGDYITGLGFGKIALILIIPLFCAVLGMFLPGSSQTTLFGGIFISTMAAAGCNPWLVAGMLPAITGAMEGMTPPMALCMYTAMGIADSELIPTTKNCIIWCILHYIVSVAILLGILPILGL
jgi:C4-dicarboxylate transporter DctM subunit